jgi:predicted MPP superfamily phosphohydrolase
VHTYDISRVPGYAEILAALREEERLYKADIAAAKEDAESSNSSDSEGTVDSATYDDDAAATNEQTATVDSTVSGIDTTYTATQQVSPLILLQHQHDMILVGLLSRESAL